MNKYQKWHDSIIEKARCRNLPKEELKWNYEKHHIIPRSVGGTNNKNNLVYLTNKEHFIIHLLLTKIYIEPKQKKSLYAAYLYMAGIAKDQLGLKEKRTSRLYESYRNEISKMNSGSGNHMFGKKQSDKQKEAVSKAMKGKVFSEETREKMRQNGLNRKQTEETKKKISEQKKALFANMSEEDKEKRFNILRNAMVGKKQTDFQKQQVAIAAKKTHSRNWIVTTPKGEQIQIYGLKDFCQNNDLNYDCMLFTSTGRTKQHKGFTCRRLETDK